ncbi:hypothetical protein GGS23DRAFT_595850 [Durotheca rogersii]|uniref:uncharacterized protein n=1 Tax=Durotheca rogersii TaxID=419775 RepID=UPI0022209035|nr:uncharacterized protein GGS23DRAFT_595850 [Durotheca rogersii]KAI5864213.1 hypothetical protein GGS23DRAFT_595850 [Durotheca rogersii]
MSFPYGYRSSAYEDERRRASYHGQSYRPNEDWDKARDTDPARQESRDLRDARGDRDNRAATTSPRPARRETDSLHRLQTGTRTPADGSKRSASLNNSPTSALSTPTSARPVFAEAASERTTKSSTVTPISSIMPSAPRASNPEVQEILEALHKWSEASGELATLRLQRDKVVREGSCRQEELSRAKNKVDDFAPFSEFQQRFDDRDKADCEAIDKKIQESSRRYQENLDRAISRLFSQVTTQSQAAAASKNESISALEAKYASLQKQTSEQQEQISQAQAQIQSVLDERDKWSNAFHALSNEFEVLKKDHGALESQNRELQQQCTALKLAKQMAPGMEELKTQAEGQAADTKGVRDDMARLSRDVQSFAAQAHDIEDKVSKFMAKVEDLDMETYNEILEAWIDHDFKNKILINEKGVVALRQDLKSLRDAAETWANQSDARFRDIQRSLEAGPNPGPIGITSGGLKPEENQQMRTYVEEKLEGLKIAMQTTVTESGDVCAEMVDELGARVDKLAAAIDEVGRLKAASDNTDIVAQISSSERITTQLTEDLRGLENRFASLESRKLGTRIDGIDRGLANLAAQIRNTQQSSGGNGITPALDAAIQGIKFDLDDTRNRLEALELSVRTLDSQWSNLNSKQMADRMFQYLEPYGQRNEVRVTSVEKEVSRLKDLEPYAQRNEARVTSVEKEVSRLKDKVEHIEQGLQIYLKDPNGLAEFIKNLQSDGKKRSSPAPLPGDDQTKKRKIDATV